jgi:hypothetical protein
MKVLISFRIVAGICSRANTCPYIHDSDKVSICPRYLRNNCPLTATTCPLSHVPNAHRMPHCQHYPNCKRGDACPYTHVQVSEDAKICKDFVGMGWCEKGDKCTERHVWECPDFEEKGVCHKRGCKLGHVVRRKGGSKASKAEAEGGKNNTGPIMFIDTKPDPTFVSTDKAGIPRIDRKRSASISVASEEYSSGEEEAANLVKKKIKIVDVPISTDAMQANEDYVTLVFSDMDDDDDETEDDGSEVESGLEEEEHVDSISRKRGPIMHTYIEDAQKQDKNEDAAAAPADSSDEEEDTETEEEAANSTITHTHTHDQARRKSISAAPRARKTSSPNDHGMDESDEDL